MKRILIGHRGVGKSSLLQRLSIYQNLYSEVMPAYDLDREIEKMAGSSVSQIFDMMGEAAFRQLEIKTLEILVRQKNYMVCVGAGFPLQEFFSKRPRDPDLEIIWVRRPSDSWGRIFLDRPRLNPELSQLEEYKSRYAERTSIYESQSNWIYDLPEGQSFPSDIERDVFSGLINSLSGGLTLLPRHARNYESFKSRQWRWDFDSFELRDDLLTDEDLQKFFVLLAKDQVTISFRRKVSSPLLLEALDEGFRADWPLELGALKVPEKIRIISVHERHPNEKLTAVITRLESTAKNGQELKLAVEIQDFSELEIGLRWQGMDPSHRSFLPRSANGKWAWVRRWLKDRQSINFIREGEGSSLDQPTMSEWMSSPASPNEFAAILGHPVAHSYSPQEHQEFFLQHRLPIYAIDVTESEWPIAMPLLIKLGLRAAAVTAPLKKEAYRFCDLRSSLAKELGALNTVWRRPHENSFVWCGDNTDFVGFQYLLDSLSLSAEQRQAVVIWGGGGTLPVLKAYLPEAQAYSIRSGKPRAGEKEILPKVLIWAGPPDAQMPPVEWRPQLIIDLNYRDDSLAKEYGQNVGGRYISGLPMFKAQAQAQQEIWQRELWPSDSRVGKGTDEV